MGAAKAIGEIENTWIPLSDGSRLAARVWLPEDAHRVPVPAVLEYLPYRKSDGTAVADRQRHPYFAANGYAAVRVDLRGTGDSDGLLRGEYLPQEQDDALEALAWLAAQPWCTGSVGMIGYSWGGFNGLQVAARRPPELKAVITIASTDDRYLDDCHYMGGCLLASDMLKWASSMLVYALQPPDPRHVGDAWRQMWRQRLREAPELARDWVSHQVRDEFWKHGSVDEDYGAIACPVLVVGGWADAYVNAVPRLLAGLGVPRLGLIGPWGHMMPYEGVPGPATDFLAEAVRWWDRWLKGIDNGVMEQPLLRAWVQEHVAPATFHAVRPGRWVTERSWPPEWGGTARWRLTAGGILEEGTSARPVVPGGAGSREVEFTGVQECGEAAGVWCANGHRDEIAGDQRPDDARSAYFDTEPLSESLEVLGSPVVRLLLAVDRPRAVLAARLADVAPDGSSLLVSWGMLNLTHRAGHEQPVPLEPGRRYEARVECRACGHRFAPGHRIRLALSPTYWPHAWPSPEPVTVTLDIGGESLLELPVRRAGSPEPPPRMVPAPSLAEAGDRRDERTRRVRVDAKSRRHDIIDREVHERTIPGSRVRYSEQATDVYSIVEGDPLSARVHCERETRSEGGPVSWKVALTSDMTCDEQRFYIREDYAAFEGGILVHRQTRDHLIPRDGV